MDEKNVFSQMDFGPLSEFLEDDDVTDISYSNAGQVWLKTLSTVSVSNHLVLPHHPLLQSTWLKTLSVKSYLYQRMKTLTEKDFPTISLRK